MLGQKDVVAMLAKRPPQHEAFQILSAYIYNKSSHGNLPSETLAKVLAIQRKIVLQHGPVPPTSPVGRAFEAAKSQLLQANRRWITMGPKAFGALGEIGSASSDDARIAWTKATDGKVKVFDDGMRGGTIAIDAGRVVGPQRQPHEAPPQYQPPEEEVDEVTGEVEGVLAGKTQQELDVEAGRANLARLRADMVRRQEIEELNREAEGSNLPSHGPMAAGGAGGQAMRAL